MEATQAVAPPRGTVGRDSDFPFTTGQDPESEYFMRRMTRTSVLFMTALAFIIGAARTTSATNITWLDMSPTAYGSAVPNNSIYNVPSIGNVTLSFSMSAVMTESRLAGGVLQAGNLLSGTYTWGNYESFATIFTVGPDSLVPELWTITYTFPGTLPAGSVYLGICGLGQTTSYGGGASVVTVNQNGTFLGDWSGAGGPWGPTQFTGGVGTFSMMNSLTGPGGQDPWWNTPLGVVKIGDAIGSITLNVSQIRGDGIGVNVGFDTEIATSTRSATWGAVKGLYR
jgi:hypothetical protein